MYAIIGFSLVLLSGAGAYAGVRIGMFLRRPKPSEEGWRKHQVWDPW